MFFQKISRLQNERDELLELIKNHKATTQDKYVYQLNEYKKRLGEINTEIELLYKKRKAA